MRKISSTSSLVVLPSHQYNPTISARTAVDSNPLFGPELQRSRLQHMVGGCIVLSKDVHGVWDGAAGCKRALFQIAPARSLALSQIAPPDHHTINHDIRPGLMINHAPGLIGNHADHETTFISPRPAMSREAIFSSLSTTSWQKLSDQYGHRQYQHHQYLQQQPPHHHQQQPHHHQQQPQQQNQGGGENLSSQQEEEAKRQQQQLLLQRQASLGRQIMNEVLISKWVINGEDLSIGRQIAAGSTGEVYEGVYERKGGGTRVKVAVKVLLAAGAAGQTCGAVAGGAFEREVIALGLCRHRNIVELVGVCRQDPRVGTCVVTRLMEGGSLRSFLERSADKLPTTDVLRLATDIARGMHYLHSRRVVHMDLKSPNIFLHHDGSAVIGDMGCARAFDEKEATKLDIGTYRWMAPEAFGDEDEIIKATPKMDVYSFGILLWELVTSKVPYIGYNPIQAATSVVLKGLRPSIPQDCFAPLKCLIEKCWAHQPSQRPNSSEILQMLHIISMHQPTNSS